jgi:hypothetical protein
VFFFLKQKLQAGESNLLNMPNTSYLKLLHRETVMYFMLYVIRVTVAAKQQCCGAVKILWFRLPHML